jgi:Tol biopolymer transport system component
MDLHAYDFASREETRLATHVGARWHPDLHIHGSHVVWEQSQANGKSEVRLLDLDSGQEQMVSSASQSNTRPQIHGDYIFWTERVACDAIDLGDFRARAQAGAFVYDLATGRKMRISSDVEPLVRIYGHIAFLTEGCQYQTRLFAIFLQP